MEEKIAVSNISNDEDPNQITVKKRGYFKRLYEWTLKWSNTKYAEVALAVLAFTESSFFPIPPDVMLISMGLSAPKKSYRFALISSIFSVLGAILGWVIGAFLFDTAGKFIFDHLHLWGHFEKVKVFYERNAFLYIWLAAFTPIPFKVFTVAAGFCDISLITLLAASSIGRPMRFFMVSSFFYFFGEKAKPFIDKYLEVLTIAMAVLAVLGVVAIKYL